MIKYSLIFFMVWGLSASAQVVTPSAVPSPTDGLVKWMTIEEAQVAYAKQKKPLLIDFYTDWCGWCKRMIATTYSTPGIANYINANFYPVKFDAETQDTIVYLGDTLINTRPMKAGAVGRKSTHQFAIKMLGSSISYPSTLFVSNDYQFNLKVPGYLDVPTIEPLLVYTVENVFKTTSYDEFSQQFKASFVDTTLTSAQKVAWISLNDLSSLSNKKKKKTLVFIHTDWCNSCKVMKKTTFTDSLLSAYIENKFHVVDLPAQTQDTLFYKGDIFPQGGPSTNYFHPFVLAATQNQLVLPTLLVMDEEGKIISKIPFFISVKAMDPIVHYFGDNAYTTTSWDDYIKKYVPLIK